MKHEGIFYGEISRKKYRFDEKYFNWGWYPPPSIEPRLYVEHKLIEDKEFIRLDIDNPPIEVNEVVFIEEINKEVTIKRRVRNAKGGYVYYTNHLIELIEDEETVKSKEEAEQQEHDYKIKKEVEVKLKQTELDEREIRKTSVEDNTYKSKTNKKWYEFWK